MQMCTEWQCEFQSPATQGVSRLGGGTLNNEGRQLSKYAYGYLFDRLVGKTPRGDLHDNLSRGVANIEARRVKPGVRTRVGTRC